MKMDEVEGIGPQYAEQLALAGIVTADVLLEQGAKPGGRAAIEKAAPGHVADVRRNFIDLLTPAELDMLAALNERILRHLAEDDSPADDEPA